MKIGLSLNVTLRNHTGPAVAGGAHSRPDRGLDHVIACASTVNYALRSLAMLKDTQWAQLLLLQATQTTSKWGANRCFTAYMAGVLSAHHDQLGMS